jgi:hypothetical protein
MKTSQYKKGLQDEDKIIFELQELDDMIKLYKKRQKVLRKQFLLNFGTVQKLHQKSGLNYL